MRSGPDPCLAVKAVEFFTQRFGVDQVALISVIDGALERHGVEFGGQIDESAHRCGDRNAVT